jgi:hypothetical protein
VQSFRQRRISLWLKKLKLKIQKLKLKTKMQKINTKFKIIFFLLVFFGLFGLPPRQFRFIKSKVKIILFLLFLAIGVGAWAESSQATTYYIDHDGGSDINDGYSGCPDNDPAFCKAKATIPALSSGDTVIFKRGVVYDNTVILPGHGTALFYTTADDVTYTVDASWGIGQAQLGDDSVSASYLVVVQHSGTKISGLSTDYEIKLTDAMVDHEGIAVFPIVENISSFQISYVEVANIGSTEASSEGHGIKVGDSSFDSYAITGGEISYNYIHDNLSYGLKHSAGNAGTANVKTHHNYITHNSIQDPSGSLGNLQINYSSGGSYVAGAGVVNCEFYNNTVINPARPTLVSNMEINNSPNKIYNNIFDGGLYNLRIDGSYNIEAHGTIDIFGNTFSNAKERGLHIAGTDISKYARVYNNLFINNTFNHITLTNGNSAYNKIWNNTFYGTGMGVKMSNGADHTDIRNNVFYQTGAGNAGLAIYESPIGASNTRDHNIYYRASGDIIYYGSTFYGASTFASYKAMVSPQDSNSLISNPLLTNPPSDVSISPNSPAMDKGINLSVMGFSNDNLNINRPQGLAWDIGAYEYTESGGDTTVLAAPSGLSAR